MNTTTIYRGVCDNQELAGMPNGDKQPMRIVEDADGRLMTEFAASSFADPDDADVQYGPIVFDESNWIADASMRFRDCEPPIPETLIARMMEQSLLVA